MFDQNATNQLILLYVFDKIDVPMQEDIVTDMATENEWLNYMDCKVALCDLIKSDFIANMASRDNTPRFAITSDGRECLESFYTQINASLRDDITENIKANRMAYRKKQDYFSDYYKNADGTYTVLLKINTATLPLLEMKLNVQSRHTAKWIFKNWGDKASAIYEMIHENLID